MNDPIIDAAQIHIPIGAVIGAMLTIAFGLWAWVLRAFGSQYIGTLKSLELEVATISKRLAVIEYALHIATEARNTEWKG